MKPKDPEIELFIEQHSRNMMSSAIYHKLKMAADQWGSEERAKTKAAAAAINGVIVWLAVLVVAAFLLPTYGGVFFILGFFAWVGFVITLIFRHLRVLPDHSR
jgi:hypothetical protein